MLMGNYTSKAFRRFYCKDPDTDRGQKLQSKQLLDAVGGKVISVMMHC